MSLKSVVVLPFGNFDAEIFFTVEEGSGLYGPIWKDVEATEKPLEVAKQLMDEGFGLNGRLGWKHVATVRTVGHETIFYKIAMGRNVYRNLVDRLAREPRRTRYFSVRTSQILNWSYTNRLTPLMAFAGME